MGSPAELVAYIIPQLSAVENSLSQPLAKLDFKQQQLGIRDISDAKTENVLSLPKAQTSQGSVLRRQSHRQFLTQPISLEAFSQFLSTLSGQSIADSPLPKYRYASAGSLYPIQAYLHIKANRIENVSSGWYYYHPTQHCLVNMSSDQEDYSALTSDLSDSDLYGPNQQLHQDSAFSLFLVANMDAIEPIYGDKARDFSLIETGYIGQLLMGKAPDDDLGLCPIGGFNSEVLQQTLALTNQQQPLHALVGGAIDPSWNQQWMAMTSPSQTTTSNLTASLKQHLSDKLPAYMVPTRYQILGSLPLTANGKVDRKALPVPNFGARLDTSTEYVAPTTQAEKTITNLWQTLLETERVGIHDNFFEVGGNSLTAMQLLSQLQNSFSVELTIAQLFGALTPAEQAKLVSNVSHDENRDLAQQTGQAFDQSSNNSQSANGQSAESIPRRHETTSIPDVDALSDDAVDDLLGQLLAENSQSENSQSENNQEVSS